MRLLKIVPDHTNIDFVRLRGLAFGLTLLLSLLAVGLTVAVSCWATACTEKSRTSVEVTPSTLVRVAKSRWSRPRPPPCERDRR